MKVAELFEKDDDEHIDKMMKNYDPSRNAILEFDWNSDDVDRADYGDDEGYKEDLIASIKKALDDVKDVEVKVVAVDGGPDHHHFPVVRIKGHEEELRKWLVDTGGEEDEFDEHQVDEF